MISRSHLIRIHIIFHSESKYMPTTGMLQVNKKKIGRSVVHAFSMTRVHSKIGLYGKDLVIRDM